MGKSSGIMQEKIGWKYMSWWAPLEKNNATTQFYTSAISVLAEEHI